MNLLRTLVKLFWNHDENRLRAFWRLGLHTTVLLLLTSVFTAALFFGAVIFDLAQGTDLQKVITGSGQGGLQQNNWIGTILLPLATFLGIFLATFIAGKWIDKRKIREFGIVFSQSWWADFSFGLFLGALLMGLIFLLGWVTGNLTVTGFFTPATEGGRFLPGFLQAVVFFLFVGIYEEVLSRGYHLINLAEGFNIRIFGKRGALILALIVSSAAFGLLHMGNPNASWFSTLNIALAGVFLGLGMVLTGSLAIPIGLHITWNLFQGNVFGFAVSGMNTGATVVATEMTGPAWLTGGPFGPEAGMMGLAAMVTGSLLTLWWLRRKGKISLCVSLSEYQPGVVEAQDWEEQKEN